MSESSIYTIFTLTFSLIGILNISWTVLCRYSISLERNLSNILERHPSLRFCVSTIKLWKEVHYIRIRKQNVRQQTILIFDHYICHGGIPINQIVTSYSNSISTKPCCCDTVLAVPETGYQTSYIVSCVSTMRYMIEKIIEKRIKNNQNIEQVSLVAVMPAALIRMHLLSHRCCSRFNTSVSLYTGVVIDSQRTHYSPTPMNNSCLTCHGQTKTILST